MTDHTTTGIVIRLARAEDADGIWAVVAPPIRAGEVFALPADMSREDALAYWTAHDTHVALIDDAIVGVSYVRANQQGGGAHVANAGYATHVDWAGRGIARALCAHSLDHARTRGFTAMQYNFVISTNARAVALWQSMGFEIVGRLPAAFDHPTKGLVPALVMHRFL